MNVSFLVLNRWCYTIFLSFLALSPGLLWSGSVGSGITAPVALEHGFQYQHDVVKETPWSIHILRIDRSRRDLAWVTSLGGGHHIGKSTLSEQVRLLPSSLGKPIGAINGDFYLDEGDLPGDPRDLQIREGELISAPTGHACFWIDSESSPHCTNVTSRLRVMLPDRKELPIGLNQVRGRDEAVLYSSAVGATTPASSGAEYVLEPVDKCWLPLQVGRNLNARVREVRNGGKSPLTTNTLVLSLGPSVEARLAPGSQIQLLLETHPNLTGVQTGIGGGPTLVRHGKPMRWSGVHLRHPRSAIGWNDQSIFLVEVDGRQAGLSAGMSFPELAEYMAKLGCQEAMNLDGGGSATLWVLGQVMNSPSEGKERPGANGLILVQRKPGADTEVR